jgi:succinyl-diaminopimelate desuccinylase
LKICVGCKGKILFEITTKGKSGHVAYPAPMQNNAILNLAQILKIAQQTKMKIVKVEGFEFPETLNAVIIKGGKTKNVIPQEASVMFDCRFAPDKTVLEATKFIKKIFKGYKVKIVETSNPAKPNLKSLQDFLQNTKKYKLDQVAKLGWTDVATFSKMNIPAFNFGCGDPSLSHTDNEKCAISHIDQEYAILKEIL